MNFFDKLNAAIAHNQSLLVVGLDPNPELLPTPPSDQAAREQVIDDLWDWLQFQLEQTADLVCAYKPTLGFYEALGARGLELLDKTLKPSLAIFPSFWMLNTATSIPVLSSPGQFLRSGRWTRLP